MYLRFALRVFFSWVGEFSAENLGSLAFGIKKASRIGGFAFLKFKKSL
jgi:hypothetical protein